MKIKNWNKFQHFKDRRPPWIKLYRDLLDDPDWHELDGDDAKALVMIWLIASEDDGAIPDSRKLAFRLRTSQTKAEQLLNRLSHWLGQDDIEMISDRYQDDAPETETETETETEKNIRAVAVATRPDVEKPFEDFWAAYPKRDGANPKAPAKKKFIAAIKSGADPTKIIEAATAYARAEASGGRIGTPYVAQAMTWLNQQRWNDLAASSTGPPKPVEPPPGAPSDSELRAKYARDAEEIQGMARESLSVCPTEQMGGNRPQ